MLSDDLQHMADFFSLYSKEGIFVSPDIAKAMVARLNEMTARAYEIEGHIVPALLRLTEQRDHDNIVSIELARKRLALSRMASSESST